MQWKIPVFQALLLVWYGSGAGVVVVVVGASVAPQPGVGGQYLNWTHPVSG